MIFFDTSAMVPLFGPYHVHSPRSRDAFHALRPEERACSQHSLAEVFNTLTKPSFSHGASPTQANEFVRYLKQQFLVVRLEAGDYLQATSVLANLNRGGPLIHDAIILEAARKVDADEIYTWNVKHFQQLAPDLADRIRTP